MEATTLTQYREAVQRILEEYATYKPAHGNIDTELIIDPLHDHYELLHVGWDGQRRVHGAVIHIDIRDSKIWIEHDGTEYGIANELAEAGIPRADIILGFRPESVRQYSGFGIS